jgi:hypothetical protein
MPESICFHLTKLIKILDISDVMPAWWSLRKIHQKFGRTNTLEIRNRKRITWIYYCRSSVQISKITITYSLRKYSKLKVKFKMQHCGGMVWGEKDSLLTFLFCFATFYKSWVTRFETYELIGRVRLWTISIVLLNRQWVHQVKIQCPEKVKDYRLNNFPGACTYVITDFRKKLESLSLASLSSLV